MNNVSWFRMASETLETNHKKHDKSQIPQVNPDGDLYKSFRGFFILGRCIGLVPISGICKRSYRDLQYKFFSLAGLTSLCCIILLSFNTILALLDTFKQSKRNAFEIGASLRQPIFTIWGLFMYTYFLYHQPLFLKIFKAWAKCNLSLTYTQNDKTLHLTIVAVSLIMFLSVVLENAVLHLEYFVQFDDINGHTIKFGEEQAMNASIIQIYYWRAHPYWNRLIGYHPVLALMAFLYHKLALYGGNYVDILIALFARALYFKFNALHKVAEEKLLSPILAREDNFGLEFGDHLSIWKLLAQDHDSLCEVLDAMNNFFSPVIFVSYTINIFFFCMQLLNSLNSAYVSYSIVDSIWSPWSFVYIVARIFLLSLCMARVNEYAHKTREIVRKCPVELYNEVIAKLDRKLNTGPQLGFTGLGCFTVTKPFMLSILNVVFTIEIVLFQGLQSQELNHS